MVSVDEVINHVYSNCGVRPIHIARNRLSFKYSDCILFQLSIIDGVDVWVDGSYIFAEVMV